MNKQLSGVEFIKENEGKQLYEYCRNASSRRGMIVIFETMILYWEKGRNRAREALDIS